MHIIISSNRFNNRSMIVGTQKIPSYSSRIFTRQQFKDAQPRNNLHYQHAIKKSIKNVLIFPSFVLIWHECQSLLASGKWYPLWPTFQPLNYYSILWLGYNLQIPEIFLPISNIFMLLLCCIHTFRQSLFQNDPTCHPYINY